MTKRVFIILSFLTTLSSSSLSFEGNPIDLDSQKNSRDGFMPPQISEGRQSAKKESISVREEVDESDRPPAAYYGEDGYLEKVVCADGTTLNYKHQVENGELKSVTIAADEGVNIKFTDARRGAAIDKEPTAGPTVDKEATTGPTVEVVYGLRPTHDTPLTLGDVANTPPDPVVIRGIRDALKKALEVKDETDKKYLDKTEKGVNRYYVDLRKVLKDMKNDLAAENSELGSVIRRLDGIGEGATVTKEESLLMDEAAGEILEAYNKIPAESDRRPKITEFVEMLKGLMGRLDRDKRQIREETIEEAERDINAAVDDLAAYGPLLFFKKSGQRINCVIKVSDKIYRGNTASISNQK